MSWHCAWDVCRWGKSGAERQKGFTTASPPPYCLPLCPQDTRNHDEHQRQANRHLTLLSSVLRGSLVRTHGTEPCIPLPSSPRLLPALLQLPATAGAELPRPLPGSVLCCASRSVRLHRPFPSCVLKGRDFSLFTLHKKKKKKHPEGGGEHPKCQSKPEILKLNFHLFASFYSSAKLRFIQQLCAWLMWENNLKPHMTLKKDLVLSLQNYRLCTRAHGKVYIFLLSKNLC